MARRVLTPYKPKQRYVPKKQKREESLQVQVCSYLRLQYPHVIFRSDYASGLQLSIAQAVQHRRLQSSRAWPDVFIYQPVVRNGRSYSGMALELKREDASVIMKIGPRKGKLSTNPHIQEQAIMLRELNRLGYYANFGIGFDDCKNKIDWYLRGHTDPKNSELF